MKPEGWYPDPSGAPDTERYWDGHSWSTVVRSTAPRQAAGWSPTGVYNPQATTPVSAQRMPVPGVPAPKRTGAGWYVLLALALLGTVALVLALWRPWVAPAPATPTPTTVPTAPSGTPVTAPTITPPPAGGTVAPTASASGRPTDAPLDCTGGQVGWNSKEPAYSAYGLTVTPSVDMPIRFDRSQWTWLHQSATWGTALKDPTGFALGGLHYDRGFGTLELASKNYLQCLTRYGVLQGAKISGEVAQAGTFDGRPAFERTFIDDSGLSFRLYVVDTADRSGYASLLVFWPTADAAAKQVADKLVSTAKVG